MSQSGDNTFNNLSNNSETPENTEPSVGAEMLERFWPGITEEIQAMNIIEFRTVELPLARIKKIMKLDEDVKMISAEVPVLFAKAAEIFIHELTLRAWLHTEENKRRTLQRNDVAQAISKHEQFDFLIDIVPREEIKASKKQKDSVGEIQYFVTLPQSTQASAIQLPNGQFIQIPQTASSNIVTLGNSPQQYAILSGGQSQPQIIQVASQGLDNVQQQTTSNNNIQLVTNANNQQSLQQQSQQQTSATPTATIRTQQQSAANVIPTTSSSQPTSTHITITAAQLQQILNASRNNSNNAQLVVQQSTDTANTPSSTSSIR